MVIVEIKGGIGNQLFQYSLGRSLALKKNTTLKLDISFYNDQSHGDYLMPHSRFLLTELKVPYELCSYAEKESLIEKSRTTVARIKRKINPYNTSLFIEKSLNFDPLVFSLPADVYLTGWFQSEQYFSSCADLLKSEITFNDFSDEANQLLARQISSTNSVAIHVRRGDYFKNDENQKYFGILGPNYYTAAISYISDNVNNPHFFLFSDDVDWVANNFDLTPNMTIVDVNTNSSPVNDMQLMSLCKHNIIANSSFSWWAACLNANPDKIVVAPELWFGTDPENVKDIIPHNWVKIPN